jgi:hypothetical protein
MFDSAGWYRWLPGVIVILIGAGYAVLEFIPSIEPPANMRYVIDHAKNRLTTHRDAADAGWGAEQV